MRVRVPQRGDKRELLATVTTNAQEAMLRHKLRRASDHNARGPCTHVAAGGARSPGGTAADRVLRHLEPAGHGDRRFDGRTEDGLAKRSEYRRFKVRAQDGQDDFAAMEEVLTRRFRNYLRERDEGARAGKRFAYPPNLLLIDGGKGQLNVAVRVLEDLGLDEIAVAGLAKRFEEVYLPGRSDPIRIPRDSEALYLLQNVRDEAHRFAITYHRQLRAKKLTRSVLDDVPGLGSTRRTRLLKQFGSVKRLRELTEDEIVAITWLPETVGRALFAQLHGERPVESCATMRSS